MRGKQEIRSQLIVPRALQQDLLYHMHDEVTAGHVGLAKTYGKLSLKYFWKNMYADCEHWVKSCTDFATNKMPKGHTKAPFLPIPVEGSFDRVAVDCLGPFPPTHSNNRYIVIFSDYLTRWPEAFAVPNIAVAETIAELLVDQIFARHGAPRTLLSNRGANFLSKLVLEVCKIINTKKINTTAYHPMTNGLVEKYNLFLAQSLPMYVASNQKDWVLFINLVLFSYRVSPNATTGDSPFYLLYGRKPRLPIDVNLTPAENLSASVAERRQKLVINLDSAYQIVRENSQRTQQKMKDYHDQNATEPNFQPGDRVWV